MQLMSDAISVLGSRHNIIVEPTGRRCYINRSGVYPGIDCQIIAGVVIDGREVVFPLCPNGHTFDFMDQDMTPCSFKLTGIDEKTTIKLELTITTPFKPRDEKFSTIPALDIRLKLSRLDSNFRGYQAVEVAEPGKIFFELFSDVFEYEKSQSDTVRWKFDSPRPLHRDRIDNCRTPSVQRDELFVHKGNVNGKRIELKYTPGDYIGKEIHIIWCTYSDAMMTVHGKGAPFKYRETFGSLDDVVLWAEGNPDSLLENSRKVDGIIGSNNLSAAINSLMAQTLHSWLINTWWTKLEGRDWFNVWEGNCYYLSTMDVEYTQSPFYLSVWPELLALELDIWAGFTHSGKEILGDKGEDTIVFMHDVGWLTEIDRTRYSHPMPVEQNSNYVLMSYGYWMRTGDFKVLRRNLDNIRKGLNFIVLSDTTGDGIPDIGTANTIDDACPSLQFGREQVYLAVKSISALQCGAEILEQIGDVETAGKYRSQAEKATKSLHECGWNKDHFNMLLCEKDGSLSAKDSGGWDATHIFASHGLVLVDMIGKDSGIDNEKIRTDIRMGAVRCLDKYGCRHSDYTANRDELMIGEFGTFNCPRVGWISMNMFRDIAAFYRGVDLRSMASRYWSFQTLVNTQGPCLFFDTFNGNRLMAYPRGLAVFGYFDAIAGLKINRISGVIDCSPLSDDVEVPVLLYADWDEGCVPIIRNSKIEGFIG